MATAYGRLSVSRQHPVGGDARANHLAGAGGGGQTAATHDTKALVETTRWHDLPGLIVLGRLRLFMAVPAKFSAWRCDKFVNSEQGLSLRAGTEAGQ